MKRTFLITTALVSILAVTAVACSDSSDETSTTSTASTATSTTTGGDAGDDASGNGGTVYKESGPIQLGVGEQATIDLVANPTTGYQWELSTQPDAAVVTVVSDVYTATPTADGMVGSGGTQRIVIQGVAAGTASIDLRYVRPWETDQSGAETATFAVTVS